ncbi:hypothetical protein VM98_36995, partial [Streptomyces rubellomurinus subsp. indigoferus]
MIVRMSCRYPGRGTTAEQLLERVAAGRDAVTGLPTHPGWQVERVYDPTMGRPGTVSRSGGGVQQDVGQFDADLFGMWPREALAMDPQQRLLLDASWEAFEHAGIDAT